MLWTFFLQIIAGILGLFLATKWVPGVEFTGPIFYIPHNEAEVHMFLTSLIFIGAFLGLLNSIIKPILNKITAPLRFITLNLLTLVIAMAMIWTTDIIFPELVINGVIALFWTTVIVWGIGFIITKWLPAGKN